MSAGAAPPPPAPPPPPPAPKIHKTLDIWNPGGHPEILRRAAGAWRGLGSALRTMQTDLGPPVTGLASSWSGGTASEKFQAYWKTQLSPALTTSASQCDQVAQQLDDTAAQIESINGQIHELWIALGVTAAVGIGLTVITLGFSDAAAAASAAAEAAEASRLVTLLQTFLGYVASNFGRLAGQWAVQLATNLAFTAGEKAIENPNHNPLSGWGPGDFAHALLSADTLVLATPLANSFSGFRAFTLAHSRLAGAALSAGSSGTAAFESDVSARFFEGKPLGLGTLVDVGFSAAVSAAASAGGSWAASKLSGSAPTESAPPLSAGSRVWLRAPGDPLFLEGQNRLPSVTGPRGPLESPSESAAPEGMTRAPSGLLVPTTPEGMTRAPSSLLVPETPEGTTRTPSGLLVPTGPEGTTRTPSSLLVPTGPEGTTRAPGSLVAPTAPEGATRLPSGLLVPHAPEGTTRSLGELPRPAPSMQGDPPSAVIQKVAPDRWEPNPRARAANFWHQAPDYVRTGVFKLPVKGIGGGVSGVWSPHPATHPPAPSAPVVTPPPPPAPVPPPPPPPVVGGGTYAVRPGDSLWAIAQRTYGDGQMWHLLQRANAHLVPDPNLIQPGQVLNIPAVAKRAA